MFCIIIIIVINRKDGMALIVEATKCTNAFPSNASRNLYSAYPAFNNAVQRHSDQILSIISKVVKLQHIKGNIQRYGNHYSFHKTLY